MPREINLRQIEAFKAVIENGTITRAADRLLVSQPAMSKLIANLEFDTGLRLFDRMKGRLAPTEHGMRLYEEIDRIFSGVRQVENAVELLRREEQGHLAIGCMPALSGAFIQQCIMAFLESNSHVECSILTTTSERIVDRVITRKLDVGIVSDRMENPLVDAESILEHPLVCILPPQHALATHRTITPYDLEGVPFLRLDVDTHGGRLVAALFEEHNIQARTMLFASTSQTICEFVAAGLGISLLHPLMVSGWEDRIVLREFKPVVRQGFRIIRSRNERNARLLQAFVNEAHIASRSIYDTIMRRL